MLLSTSDAQGDLRPSCYLWLMDVANTDHLVTKATL
jgi:hypothetical protein